MLKKYRWSNTRGMAHDETKHEKGEIRGNMHYYRGHETDQYIATLEQQLKRLRESSPVPRENIIVQELKSQPVGTETFDPEGDNNNVNPVPNLGDQYPQLFKEYGWERQENGTWEKIRQVD